MHGGARVAEFLDHHDVPFLYTLCGGHISPILAGCRERGIRVVDVRHEATAVFAADATARLTGKPGVACVTAGPGLTNVITALKNAQLARTPLLLLGGAVPTLLQGRGALQDIDQMALIAPHVKNALQVKRRRNLVPALRDAFHTALGGIPGPVFVELPVDLLYPYEIVESWYRGSAPRKAKGVAARMTKRYVERRLRGLVPAPDERTAKVAVPAAARATDATVSRAAGLLRRARRPVMIVGSQALLAPADAAAVAEAISRLEIPVYLASTARGLLGREHALQLRHRRREALKEADCVLLAGVPCDFRLNYGHQIARGALVIHANLAPRELKLNNKPDVAVLAHPGLFLEQLAAERSASTAANVNRHANGEWLNRLREREAEREAEIASMARQRGAKVHPVRLLRALDEELGNESIVVADGGDFVATAAYTLRPPAPLSWLDPGPFGTLGVGAGFALAAKLCRPKHDVWLLYGDGACGFSLMELDTFRRHKVGIVAIVGNDGKWAQIHREQVPLLGDDVATTLERSDYHKVASSLGGEGFLLSTNGRAKDVLRRARTAARRGKPALVNAILRDSDFRAGAVSM